MAETEEKPKTGMVWSIFNFIVTLLLALVYSAGAARLAYIRTSSGMMATLAFFLSPIYYVYYAFTQPATLAGAGRAMRYVW